MHILCRGFHLKHWQAILKAQSYIITLEIAYTDMTEIVDVSVCLPYYIILTSITDYPVELHCFSFTLAFLSSLHLRSYTGTALSAVECWCALENDVSYTVCVCVCVRVYSSSSW